MKKKNVSKKNLVLLICAGALIIFAVIYNFAKGTGSYPSGKLSDTKGSTVFNRDEEKFPLMYVFEDTDYAIAVPSKGITPVEGGYAYTYNGYGLVVAEVSNARTLATYSGDLYSSLYAITSNPSIEELHTEEGYINGYSASYGVYSAKLDEAKKQVYEFIYMLKTERENIVLVATTESKKQEDFTGARDLLVEMIGTLTPYAPKNEEEEKEPSDDPVEEVSVDEYMSEKDEVLTRQAVISASQDYEKMCLIFSYMNVNSKPEEVYVLDKNNKKYNAAFINPGEYGFVIPNVSLGDDLTIIIKSAELNGTTVSQEEYDLYQQEQKQYKDGNLHVEEEYEDFEEDTDVDVESEAIDDLTQAIDSIDNQDLKETFFNALDQATNMK